MTATPTPRGLYADLVCAMLKGGSPPECKHYMNEYDFTDMNEHIGQVVGRLQQYLAGIGEICRQNSHAIDVSAFQSTFIDALADVSGTLVRAAEQYRADHQQAAE